MTTRPMALLLLLSIPVIPHLTSSAVISAVPAAQDHQHDHHPAPPVALRQNNIRRMTPQPVLRNITLVDSSGRSVALETAATADVPVLLNFIFTSCTTICPVMSAGFAQLEARLRAEQRPVRLISISIDSEVDTPARLREYATRFGVGADWQLLTGSSEAAIAAQRAFGAYRGGIENHVPVTYVRRSAAVPWEQLDGLQSAAALLRAYHGTK